MRDVPLIAGQDHQAGGPGLPVALFALAGGGVVQWLPLIPSLLMSAAALAGGLSAILPAASTALSTYLDRRQARRHAEAEFRRRIG